MRRNRKTTIGKLLDERRIKFLDTDELYDENWDLYLPFCDTLTADTKCYIGVPVGCDENGEDVVPEAAEKLGMTDILNAELIDNVVSSMLYRKRKADINELVDALNYYIDNDCFITPKDVDENDNIPKIWLKETVPDKRTLLNIKRALGADISLTELVEMNQSPPCIIMNVKTMAEAKKLIRENELDEWLKADY
jgi:hypothetical protein